MKTGLRTIAAIGAFMATAAFAAEGEGSGARFRTHRARVGVRRDRVSNVGSQR